jgi:transcriptional regulator with XRE-family HTH domain
VKNPQAIKAFSERFKALLKEKGMSYGQVAAEADLTKATVVRIAGGKVNVSLDNIISLAKALKVDFKVLMDFQE